MKKLLILIFLICFSVTNFAQKENDSLYKITKLILVRHAEKNDSSNDPELSEKGKLRAQKLSDLFADMKIDKLYSTPYNRTKQTLAIVATEKGLAIEKYNPSDVSFSTILLENNLGKTALIVGHSNTIPNLVNFLIGENKYKQLEENEFGKIWVLTFIDKNLVDCVLLNY
jgi:broad specificity phosphatase PhoE